VNDRSLHSLKSQLESLIHHTLSVPGGTEPELDALFTREFMEANTNFSSLDGFLEASPLNAQSDGAPEDLIGDRTEDFVREQTEFGSWPEMRQQAEVEWMKDNIR